MSNDTKKFFLQVLKKMDKIVNDEESKQVLRMKIQNKHDKDYAEYRAK